MTKTPKRPRDPNQLAKLVVDLAAAKVPERELTSEEQGKNPSAVNRGQLGGLIGGKARAQSLSEDRRREISRKAAKTRWSRVKEHSD